MEQEGSFSIRDSNALGIFKTIYLFLLNHNLPNAAEIFKNECGLYGDNFEKVLSKSLLLRKCRCAKHQANQTEIKGHAKAQQEWLDGTFEGGPFQVKEEETHIFYVCDHCHKTNDVTKRESKVSSESKPKGNPDEFSTKTDFVKLKSKFSELQGEHQKLIAVTSELTTALQMNIIGQTKNIHSVLEQCKTIYPTLFTPSPTSLLCEHPKNVKKYHENTHQEISDSFNVNEFAESCNKEDNRVLVDKNSYASPSPQNVEAINLNSLSPRSQLKTPLTPQTVRQILETVLERIFEYERTNPQTVDSKNSSLQKDEVEKIVNDVLHDINKTPLNYNGAGEGGEMSRPGSTKECVSTRNSENFFDTNYAKIKRDLIHGDNDKKIRILQALRWRITKNDGPVREKVMDSYIVNDILQLNGTTSIPETLLTGYNNDQYVQESTCRLVNTLASLRQGRDYLTMDDRLLKKVLIKKVKDIRNVSSAVIRNMLVASVQKLSIRKQSRALMVKEGLFEILVDYLNDFYEKLSRYCLEYCSALLMNLCLVDEAKERSTKNPKKIIGLVRKFLEGENECCLPYINGVMFSLLEKEDVVNEAKNQNLDKLLIRLIRVTSNENIKKQLDFIVQSRLFGKSDPNMNDSDEENKEEVDLLEIELDQDDFITQLPSGEKLLEEYKSGNMANKRDYPSSAKSFSEENKQFIHKPSAERGIFEGTKPRRFTTCSQALIRNYVRNKKVNRTYGSFPATPMCYMENCQRLQEGNGATCTCSKCVPGQSRYNCGCYDVICKEIAEDDMQQPPDHSDNNYGSSQMDFGKAESKNRW